MGQRQLKCTPQDDLDCYYNREWKQYIGKIKYRLPVDNFVIIKNMIDEEMYQLIMNAKFGTNQTINNLVMLRESYFNRKQYSEHLKVLIEMIKSINNISGLANIIRLLNSINIQVLFDIHVVPHYREPDVYTILIGEFPLTFEKEYYEDIEKNIDKYADLLGHIYNFVTKEWKYSGSNRKDFINNIIKMELLFSESNLSIEESIKPKVINNSSTYDEFVKTYDAHGFWKTILNNLVNGNMYISYVNKVFLVFLRKFLRASQHYSFTMIHDYLIYCLIKKYGYLTNIEGYLMDKLYGQIDRKKIFLELFYNTFGYYLESIYEVKHSNIDKNQCICEMFTKMKEYCIDIFNKSNFFRHSTKLGAIKKLNTLDIVIGKQDHMIKNVEVSDLGDDIYQNLMKIDYYYYHKMIEVIGKRVNKRCMSVNHDIFSFQLNAYYDSLTNMIYVPTSITHDFFLMIDRDPIYNYGSLGSIIGHEMMHCFDNQGAQYDHLGHLQNWWAPEDYQTFYHEIKKINEHYSYLISDNTKANLMISENMADITGLKLSLRTYIKLYMPYTNIKQLSSAEKEHLKKFFKSWAKTLRRSDNKDSDDDNDLHAPNDIRINAPFSHIDEYYQIYDVKPEHRNYLPPHLRTRFMDI
jgi:putative endopeptidase